MVGRLIIDCVSDLHGHYPDLQGGDLLIICGDLTARDQIQEYVKFIEWLQLQQYTKKVVIAGNHDNEIEKCNGLGPFVYNGIEYLCDSGTEFESLKIWGSPWTLNFEGQNPKCKAFGLDTEEELKAKWDLIPDDIDILITHSPAYGNLDITSRGESVGSMSLFKKVTKIKPRLFVFGHIHESYGKGHRRNIPTRYVNASHVNERYNPVNEPIRVIL